MRIVTVGQPLMQTLISNLFMMNNTKQKSGTTTVSKRGSTSDIDGLTDEIEHDQAKHLDDIASGDNWPRHFVGKGTSEDFPISKLNPFVLKKAIEGMVGDVKQVSSIRGDLIYIEVDRRIHAVKLLKTKQLGDCPVVFTPHKTRNYSKGVINCKDLRSMTDEQLQKRA